VFFIRSLFVNGKGFRPSYGILCQNGKMAEKKSHTGFILVKFFSKTNQRRIFVFQRFQEDL